MPTCDFSTYNISGAPFPKSISFSSFAKHPEKVIIKRYTSAAAGAYQFLPGTWKMASRKLGLMDFGPRNQDQAALFLIERRNALALADQGKLTPQLLAKLAPEWASLPTMQAQSFYGQPVKKHADLKAFYEQSLEQERRQAAGMGPISLVLS